MRVRVAAFLVLTLAAPVLSGDAPKKPGARGIERRAEFVARVNESAARGVEWLRKAQKADGSFEDYPDHPGATTALVYHTLRMCGVPRTDAAMVKAWDGLVRRYRKEDLTTYLASVLLMAIESHGEPVTDPAARYDVQLSAEDASWAAQIAGCLAAGQDGDGSWGYWLPGGARAMGAGKSDNSNTQYALFGLKSASRCGVPVDPGVWSRSLRWFMETQASRGGEVERTPGQAPRDARPARPAVLDRARGWVYQDYASGESGTVAMTAGGVSSIVICRSELLGTRGMPFALDESSERCLWDGIAWLGSRWNPPGVPPGEAWRPGRFADERPALYDYYSVERAGVLAGVEWMAGIDWYGRGALAVMDAQVKGGWAGVWGRLSLGARAGGADDATIPNPVDTCFALLFLKKGTTPVRRGAVTPTGGEDDIRFSEAAKLPDRDFEDFVDLVLSRSRRAWDDDVRRRIFEGATAVGPRIVEPLLRRLEDADAAKRASANALLRHATGRDFDFVADAPADARDLAATGWQTWWMRAKEKLAYDAESKRLVER